MKTFIYALFLLFACSLHAQELPYTFSAFNSPYYDLVDPTPLSDGDVWDDPEYIVPVGFTFDMMGEQFDSLIFGGLGGQLIPYINEMEVCVIALYLSDIADAGGVDGETSLSPISYKVEGTEPNRIFKLEWKDCGFYNEIAGLGTAYNKISFQLWLYEFTNVIEYRFGPNTIKDTEVHQSGHPFLGIAKNIDLETGATADGIWLLGGDPVNPNVVPYVDLMEQPTLEMMLDSDPPGGTVYRFDTGIISVSEHYGQNSLQVFPSPANDFVFVTSANNSDSTFRILNCTGAIVKEGTISFGLNRIALENFSSGLYFLQSGESVKSFVKN